MTQATEWCTTVHGLTLTYEAIYTLSFVEEDGELKVSRCKEFIDSKEYGAFTANITKAVAEGMSISSITKDVAHGKPVA